MVQIFEEASRVAADWRRVRGPRDVTGCISTAIPPKRERITVTDGAGRTCLGVSERIEGYS